MNDQGTEVVVDLRAVDEMESITLSPSTEKKLRSFDPASKDLGGFRTLIRSLSSDIGLDEPLVAEDLKDSFDAEELKKKVGDLTESARRTIRGG